MSDVEAISTFNQSNLMDIKVAKHAQQASNDASRMYTEEKIRRTGYIRTNVSSSTSQCKIRGVSPALRSIWAFLTQSLTHLGHPGTSR